MIAYLIRDAADSPLSWYSKLVVGEHVGCLDLVARSAAGTLGCVQKVECLQRFDHPQQHCGEDRRPHHLSVTTECPALWVSPVTAPNVMGKIATGAVNVTGGSQKCPT